MRRGAKPAKAKVEAKLPVAHKSSKSEGTRVRHLEKHLAEALEQQTATSEILSVISSSPTDLQPVFDTIAERSLRLCGGLFSSVYRFDGELIHMVAHHNYPPVALERSRQLFPTRPGRHLFTARAILERSVVLVTDVMCDPDWEAHDIARAAGFRSVLAVPMLRGDDPIGSIVVWHTDVGPFSEKHIALLKTFADPAVIAIENVRLFKELEARNRDLTATSQILQAISSSPTDTQPVFDTIVRSAAQLCHAAVAAVFLTDGRVVYHPANYGASSEALAATRARFPRPVDMESTPGIAILTRSVVHVSDVDDPSVTEHVRQVGTELGFRSMLTVPMLRESEAVGAITVTRREPGRFSDAEVELLKTFADQAIIAIENVRLFRELQDKNRALTDAHAQVSESLEQQTATAEILSVISGSPTDIRPVFDAVLDRALTLCEASDGSLYQLDDGALRHVGARGIEASTAVGGVLSLESVSGRAVLEKRTVHIEDVLQELDGLAPEVQVGIRRARVRTLVAVPLLREQTAIGAIVIRRLEVRPFSEKQIRLLQTFADQAVIAIENVRLFTELQEKNRALTEAHGQVTEALNQQTATSEILRVISSSPTDVQPVFDTIVTSAGRLCGAESAVVYRFEAEMADAVALYNVNPDAIAAYHRRFPRRLRDTDHLWRVADGSVLNIADITDDPHTATAQEVFRSTVNESLRMRDVRSLVLVPMVRDEQAIGAIGVSHHDVGAFSEERVRLLKTFAAQAVIAIENVRLFSELQARNRDVTDALEQQTATGEILRVIASSPTDLQPVLDALVESASRLCPAGPSWTPGRFTSRTSPTPRPSSRSARRLPSGSGTGPRSRYHFSAKACRSGPSSFDARRYGSSRTRRSHCSRPSPIRRSSQSRMFGCSRNWRPEARNLCRLWINRQRRRRSLA